MKINFAAVQKFVTANVGKKIFPDLRMLQLFWHWLI